MCRFAAAFVAAVLLAGASASGQPVPPHLTQLGAQVYDADFMKWDTDEKFDGLIASA